VNRFLFTLILVVSPIYGLAPWQDPAPSAPKKAVAANDKFSGTITELNTDSLTVVRTVPARDAVSRRFTLDPQTRVEGKLRLKARVTVQYESVEDGQFRAVHIIVR
jgi:hypothetical protein